MPGAQNIRLTFSRLDKGPFRNCLLNLRAKVFSKEHLTVAGFAQDVVSAINSDFGSTAASITELVASVSGRAEDNTSTEDRERRSLVRRIVKGIEPLIEDALRKEAELNRRPYAEEMREMDEALLSRRESLAQSIELPALGSVESRPELEVTALVSGDVDMVDTPAIAGTNGRLEGTTEDPQASVPQVNLVKHEDSTTATETIIGTANTPPASMNGFKPDPHTLLNGDTQLAPEQPSDLDKPNNIEPPTPPLSMQGANHPPQQIPSLPVEGGIPWYVEQFDPEGTTIYEERWTGPEVLRDLSEELSEMDEDELYELGPGEEEIIEDGAGGGGGGIMGYGAEMGKKKKKARGNRWGDRSFRHRR
jgi:NuA3 HAT complex component NTO1